MQQAVYSSTLKMKAVGSSETSLCFKKQLITCFLLVSCLILKMEAHCLLKRRWTTTVLPHSCWAYSSTLKVRVVRSPETSLNLHKQFVACFLLICCVTYSSFLKMEAAPIKPALLLTNHVLSYFR
jgi:isoprenylcysteine carboxyl methyltransferase (ICMT) family protein YpbQ